MQSVGQILRAARLAQGWTLEQVHSSTKISVRTLEAIEADDLKQISSAFLYKSFIKQFAEFLKVEPDELVASIEANTSRMPRPLMPGEAADSNFRVRVPALQIRPRRRARWLRPILSFALALTACTGLYTLWQQQKLHLPLLFSTPPTPAQTTTPVPQTALPALHDQPAPPAAQQEARRSNPGGFTLQLSATEPAWLSIVADGKVSFRGILERAETKILEGHQMARIRTGNAGAVEAVFNGKPIGTLGSRGQVRTVVFTRNDYEVLDSSPKLSLRRPEPDFELARNITRPSFELQDSF